MDERLRAQLILDVYNDPVRAHQTLFAARHPLESPGFHAEMARIWHDYRILRAIVLAFRGAGKSTTAEEAITIRACLKLFRNCVILGESQDKAIERLTAIKQQLLYNDMIVGLFGNLEGKVWGASKIEMANGVVIQAMGRGQEVRGMKHLDTRPDFLFGDDLEAKEHVKDEAARFETRRWFYAELLPALDTKALVRIQATPLDREALSMTLFNDKARWYGRKWPVRYIDQVSGAWVASWPAMLSLEQISDKELEFEEQGLAHDFQREFMCEPENPAKKIFTADMFKVVPRVRVWEATYAMLDPARTTHERSASTGWAVWSWIGSKLIVWDAGAGYWKPDEQVDKIFAINELYSPVEFGVEENGLNEWLNQPIRAQMIKRGVLLPYQPYQAPKGKHSFIESLQPFFKSGAVEFAKDLPELRAQLLGFPTGRIDAPNALAYSMQMKPGHPIYDNFGNRHVVEDVDMWGDAPVWLAFNSDNAYTTAVLCQFADGAVHIKADWVREGDPGRSVRTIYDSARLEIGNRRLRCVVGPAHFVGYDTIGLRPAIGRLPADVIQGGVLEDGRATLRDLLGRTLRGFPAVQIGHAARWTLNGFAAGYARFTDKHGTIHPQARPGCYKVLMEGLESFAGIMSRAEQEDDMHQNWAYDSTTGQRYKTINPRDAVKFERKSDWIDAIKPDRVLAPEHQPKTMRRR